MQNNYQSFPWLEFEDRRDKPALNGGLNSCWTALPKKMVNLLFRRAFKLRYTCFSERCNLVQVYTVGLWWT